MTKQVFNSNKSNQQAVNDTDSKLTSNIDLSDRQPEPAHYYMENGYMVFTRAYHLARGYCCGNTCRHCPFEHENV